MISTSVASVDWVQAARMAALSFPHSLPVARGITTASLSKTVGTGHARKCEAARAKMAARVYSRERP